MLHLVGCLCHLYQWCSVTQISENEIYILIKYIKSVLWRVVKRLLYIEDARCRKVKEQMVSKNGRNYIFNLRFLSFKKFLWCQVSVLSSWEDNIEKVIKYVKWLFEGCIHMRSNTDFFFEHGSKYLFSIRAGTFFTITITIKS